MRLRLRMGTMVGGSDGGVMTIVVMRFVVDSSESDSTISLRGSDEGSARVGGDGLVPMASSSGNMLMSMGSLAWNAFSEAVG